MSEIDEFSDEEKRELQAKFRKFLDKYRPGKDKAPVSDAVYLMNEGKVIAKELGITLKQIMQESKNTILFLQIQQDYRDKLEDHFNDKNRANQYADFLGWLADCYNDKEKITYRYTKPRDNFSYTTITDKTIITQDMIEQAYKIGIMVYKNQIDRKKGAELLESQYGWNQNTAIMHIDNIRNMLNGNCYRSIMSKSQTDYYLKMIKEEFGEELYKKALSARNEHEKRYGYKHKEKRINKTIHNSNNNLQENEPLNKKSDIIVNNIFRIIRDINKKCKNYGKRKIFISEIFERQEDITNICNSENDFKNFIINLGIMLKEYTRYDNPNRKPPFDYMLPDQFMKDGTATRLFWNNINTLRNEYAHSGKGNIIKVYEKYLGKGRIPETTEDYQKLQIDILIEFENAINNLLKMINNDLNCLK